MEFTVLRLPIEFACTWQFTVSSLQRPSRHFVCAFSIRCSRQHMSAGQTLGACAMPFRTILGAQTADQWH